MTPADELRALLASSEKRIANLKGSGAGAVELMLELDRIDELWPELEAQGMDLRPEAGRWETIQAQLRRSGPQLLRELNATGGLDKLRREQHPEYAQPDQEISWWWGIDALVRQDQARRLKRNGIALAAVPIVGLAVVLIFQFAFPVDPAVKAAMGAQSAGEQKIMSSGDFQAALDDFAQAVQFTPNEPDAWLRLGAAQQKLGDMKGAENSYAYARGLYQDELKFLLARAAIFLSFMMIDEGEADLTQALAREPDNAVAHYYMGTVYEGRGQVEQAIESLQKASDLATESDQAELVALARYRMGMLLQQMQVRGPGEPAATPTVTPTATS
jgi:tetratricopeptide (TPR) repeat protein